MLPQIKNYDDLYRQFRWQIAPDYNIGVDVCDRWAALDPRRIAIVHVHPDGRHDDITFGWLKETSDRLAQCAARAWRQARRPRRDSASADARSRGRACRDLQARGGRAADGACCSVRMRFPIACRIPARVALITNAQGLAKIAEIRSGMPSLEIRDLGRRRRRRRARFQGRDRKGVVCFHARADNTRYARR